MLSFEELAKIYIGRFICFKLMSQVTSKFLLAVFIAFALFFGFSFPKNEAFFGYLYRLIQKSR